MADSAFWRNLSAEFKTLDPTGIVSARWESVRGPTHWRLIGTHQLVSEFQTLAMRGAYELEHHENQDLLIAWLEALRQAGIYEPSYIPPEPIEDGEGPPHVTDTIKAVCSVSATYCRTLESRSLQSEFEQKQRNDPRNWSPLHQRFEAFKKIKELQSGPHEQIPESLVRETVAQELGIKPEEVTQKQVNLAVADLLPYYHAITLIPSKPAQPEPIPGETVPAENTPPVIESRPDPMVLRDSYLANFPDEKIKIRDLCWAVRQHYREWKRWLAGEMKDGSTADLAFRRILTSGKRPREFDKTPRPKGWE